MPTGAVVPGTADEATLDLGEVDAVERQVAVDQIEAMVEADRGGGTSWIDIVGPIVVFGALVGFWYFMHHWGLEHIFHKQGFLMPPLHEILYDSFVRKVPQPDGGYYIARDDLLPALLSTARVALLGLSASIVIGISIAVLMNRGRWVERTAWPYLIAMQAIPILAIVPIVGSIFGYETNTRILICVMISIFPIISNTLFGLQSVERSQHDLFTLKGVSNTTRLFKLEFPAAMPAIFAGFRISAGLSVIGAVVGELFFRQGSTGIGIVMDKFRSRSQWTLTYGALFLTCLLGIAVFLLFTWLSKLVIGKWYESAAPR